MHRLRFVLVIALLASCAGEPESIISPSTTGVVSPTSSPTSTTSPAGPVEWPWYLVYGWHGVDRVAGAGLSDYRKASVQRLTSDPVLWAVEDGAGGIVYRSVTEEPGWVWLAAGAEPQVLDLEGVAGVVIPAMVNDGPSLLVSQASHEATANCPQSDVVVEDVLVRDLATGGQRPLVCLYQSSDAGWSITSYGGGLFTVELDVSLIGHTSGALRFLDLSGEEVSVEHNPFAESCAPCELDAALSPDGRLLAYAYWPTASIARAEPADGDYTRALDEWLEVSKDIPTELVVLDLSTGEEVWRSETLAQASLVGFDGRFVTVVAGAKRGIYDTRSGERVGIPPAMTEPAAFWTAVLASLDAATHNYGDAHAVAADLASRHGVETGVVWSDGWLTLEDGYWAVITGRYDSLEEAAGMCDSLGLGSGDCYPRYVATVNTIDPEIGRGMVELRVDGLGVVDFEDPAEQAREVFSRVVGSAPIDGWSSAAWVDYVGWNEYGLYLGFSTPQWTGWDGTSRFVGWDYSLAWAQDPSDLPNRFRTSDGVTIGTTVDDLLRVYGESLRLPVEEEVCVGWVVGLPDGVLATLDGPPSDDAEVVRLFFGVGVGC